MTLAVCIRVTFRSVHVVIEMHTHPIPVLVKQVYGTGSLATLKGGIGPAYGLQTHQIRSKGDPLQTTRKCNAYALKET